jgi:PAS domain S-box-containing protein
MINFVKTFAFRTSLAIFTIVVVLLIGLFFFLRIGVRGVITDLITEEVKSNLKDVRMNSEDIFDNVRSDVNFLRNLRQLKELDIQNPESYSENISDVAKIFEVFSNEKKVYYQVRYIDNSGQEVVRVDYRNQKAEIVPNDQLQNKADREYFKETSLLDVDGLYVSTVDLNREGTPPIIESPYRSVIRHAAPVFSEDGERMGIVIINSFAKTFIDSIANDVTNYAHAQMYIVDKDGFYIYNPNPEKEWGGSKDLDTGYNLSEDFIGLDKQILQDDSGVIESGASVITFTRIHTDTLNKQSYIIAIRSIPYDVLYSPLTEMTSIVVVPMIASLGLMLICIYIGSKIIIKPVLRIKESALKMARGNFGERAKVGTTYLEMEELGSSFNKMAENLQSYSMEIEQKISERTSQLSTKLAELEETKQAVLNIMDDLEDEKEMVTREKNKIDIIVQSIGDAVLVVDRDLKIQLFNEVAERLTGVVEKDAIGKYYYDVLSFVDEFSGKPNDDFIKRSIEEGALTSMDRHTLLKRKDGTTIPVADSAAPVKTKVGLVVGCVIVFRDVTLERNVDKAKTEFVSLASHQLKTPLSAIKWYVEMMLGGDAGKFTKEQKEFMKEIEYENLRMIELVNALLNVSRIELGTFAVDPKPTDVIEISNSIIKELTQQIKKKELNVKTEYAKDIPMINLDPKLIRIVFQNLISNAVKYTPEKGNILINISKDETNLKIKVQDTGYGIPKAQQDKIFSKLFRADNIRKFESDGTGLGLYIVKSIIDSSEGKVWFESEENKGTTFYIELPLKGMSAKEGNRELT